LKNIDIDIDMAILENIDIDIDIDKGILQNIDIDKISYRLGFGISNTPNYNPCIFCHLSVDHQTPGAVTLAPPRLQPRPGLRKRKMSGAENSREVDDSSSIKIRGEGSDLGITGAKTMMSLRVVTKDQATEASQKVKCEDPVGQEGILNPVPKK